MIKIVLNVWSSGFQVVLFNWPPGLNIGKDKGLNKIN